MAGLFLIRDEERADLAGARAQFAKQGFAAPTEHGFAGWRLLHFDYIQGGPQMALSDGHDLVAVAGTLTVDALMGRPALAALLAMDPLALDWSRIGGQFAAIVRKRGRTFVFTDYMASFQLFHDVDRQVFSTSLLAAANALPRVSFDPQGVYELAFNVMPVGDDTVFAELRTLGPRHIVELTPDGAVLHQTTKPLPTTTVAMPIAERVERARVRLSEALAPYVAQFGSRIHCPLSGGIDSRLLLAALRAGGADPHVYVYGPPGSADVRIAQAIGEAQHFPVDWIEKARVTITPDAFPGIVARNFQEMDALPTFGNIFDNGGNLAARDARHAGGALAASGGCGEIYRDFFFLADRPTTPASVARTFFARFTRRDATALFDPQAFLRRIGGKIAAMLEIDHADQRISRAHVEQIYPRVRCRALFGREISLEARHGAYAMPFLDHRVIADALTLPVALRPAGRFESMLLTAIDPAIAALPSAYGHHFAGPPSRHHRFTEWSSRTRPIWLRQQSYAIQRRLRPLDDEHGGLLAPDYMARVIDLDFPAMRAFFDIERVTDAGVWRRIANLEYLAAQLGSKLAA